MKRLTVILLGVVMLLLLAACGQQGTATDGATASEMPMASDMAEASAMASDMPMASEMAEMSAMASEMPMESASGSEMPMASDMASEEPMASGTEGMDHGAMGSADANAPYDARFIDSMIEHHTGAITMAEQALDESERTEIRDLAQNIIDTQRQEVDQMQQWRDSWYAGLAPTGGMGMDMGDMEVGGDASVPFDQRFITAMVAHHQGAIDMAKDAQQNAEHQEIKDLAGDIITAQEAEISQLEQWEKDWFGQ